MKYRIDSERRHGEEKFNTLGEYESRKWEDAFNQLDRVTTSWKNAGKWIRWNRNSSSVTIRNSEHDDTDEITYSITEVPDNE